LLTLGQRRIWAVARALAAEPDVLMLDEPAAGLDDGQVDEFRRFLRNLAEQWGIGVLLIEHHVGLVMSVCDRVYVLQAGQIISSGTPDEVSRDSQVVSAYLGSEIRAEELEASLVDAHIGDDETKAPPS
jgi:sulfate-transporting ATPase